VHFAESAHHPHLSDGASESRPRVLASSDPLRHSVGRTSSTSLDECRPRALTVNPSGWHEDCPGLGGLPPLAIMREPGHAEDVHRVCCSMPPSLEFRQALRPGLTPSSGSVEASGLQSPSPNTGQNLVHRSGRQRTVQFIAGQDMGQVECSRASASVAQGFQSGQPSILLPVPSRRLEAAGHQPESPKAGCLGSSPKHQSLGNLRHRVRSATFQHSQSLPALQTNSRPNSRQSESERGLVNAPSPMQRGKRATVQDLVDG